jgi:hypothetical protein
MKRFEYKVEASVFLHKNYMGQAVYEEPSEERLNELGQDGWEVILARKDEKGDTTGYLLKRELNERL